MASRSGPRAAGTDGSDFAHRELIDSRYRTSSALKPRLRLLCFLHSLLLVLAGARAFAQPKDLPQLGLWELGWLSSCLAPLVSLLALQKNRALLLRLAVVSHLFSGFLPVTFGIVRHSVDLSDFFFTKKDQYSLPGGLPYTPTLFFFLSLCIQVHGFSAYYCYRLVGAWSRPVGKKAAAKKKE